MDITLVVRLGRIAAGMTQEQLGMALGYMKAPQASVSDWESGKKPVPRHKLKEMSKLLNIPLEKLIP